MPCLDENTIVAFLTGSLARERATLAEAHLADCGLCRRTVAEVAAVTTAAPASRVHTYDHGTHRSSRVFDPTIPGTHASDSPSADGRSDLARRVTYAQAARRIGTVIHDKWRIDGLLGIGGMAQVFAGTHRNGRRVAIKVMRPELALEPSLVQRFLREGYVANKVGHAGAVTVLDDDVLEDGTPFLVMELLEGQSLAERIHALGPIPLGHALAIVDQILSVLASAHERGIVHRDLKPDNLFETNEGTIKVLDFGIARLRERMANETATKSGVTMGTVGYMAPEQARGHAVVDAKSDIWAIGATLYSLLTGKTLHAADTVNESLLRAMTEPVPPLATLVPSLPPAVAAAIDRALAFDRDKRYESAVDMQRALKDAVRAASLMTPTPAGVVLPFAHRAPSPQSRYLAFGAGLLVLVGIVSAAAVGWVRHSRHVADTTAGTTETTSAAAAERSLAPRAPEPPAESPATSTSVDPIAPDLSSATPAASSDAPSARAAKAAGRPDFLGSSSYDNRFTRDQRRRLDALQRLCAQGTFTQAECATKRAAILRTMP